MPFKINSIGQRILASCLGLLLVLVLLEIGLRIVGAAYLSKRAPSTDLQAKERQGHFVILCLGNSFTLGSGAPPGQSYPDQLQRLFDERMPEKNIAIVNGGVGNQNTAELLGTLNDLLRQYSPNLVILQTGQPNGWNYYQYSTYEERIHPGHRPFRKAIHFLKNSLYKSRIYRLALLLSQNIEETSKSRPGTGNGSYRGQKGYLEAQQRIEYNDRNFFADDREAENAIQTFKQGIEQEPEYPLNYCYIGQVYLFRKNYDEALDWFIRAIKANPRYRDNGRPNFGYTYVRRLKTTHVDEISEHLRKRIDAFIEAFKKANPDLSENFLALSADDTDTWARSDIIEIIRALQQNHIPVLLQNYPPLPHGPKRSIDAILRDIAAEQHVPFVDQERLFQEMEERGEKLGDYFEPGGHCNARGYGVMATNIFDALTEERTLPP